MSGKIRRGEHFRRILHGEIFVRIESVDPVRQSGVEIGKGIKSVFVKDLQMFEDVRPVLHVFFVADGNFAGDKAVKKVCPVRGV